MLKYKLSILFTFLLCLGGAHFVLADTPELELLGKVIYIDPGHGGLDPGAIHKDIYESALNLQISNKLVASLEAKGAIVYMTRYGDYDLAVTNAVNRKRSDLSRRANIINRSLCDLYISIHLNADTSATWRGAQVFYDDINENNIKIAETLQNVLKEDLKTKRKYKQITNEYLHKRVKMPGVLVEVGFITNDNERYLLKQSTYQQKVANSITRGVIKYFDNL